MDAMTMVSRVLERALERYTLSQTGAEVAPPASGSAEDTLVDALATQLLGAVGVGRRPATHDELEVSPLLYELQQRNRRVASAVGACECWGEVPVCARCAGQGVPGWRIPERASFDVVVRPALDRISSYRLTGRNGHGRVL